ncbi:hypothetical protein [Novosphingobium pokkalii]|uniref:Secreted protein n=1 Tax=Novosphingobium pokkalii TaxID=1770194 RepID=A0ABV7UZN1_9SPHN|nr:hypothetical protein [Novosphingobium pokkalii]
MAAIIASITARVVAVPPTSGAKTCAAFVTFQQCALAQIDSRHPANPVQHRPNASSPYRVTRSKNLTGAFWW